MNDSDLTSLSRTLYQSTTTPYLPVVHAAMLSATPWWKPQLCGPGVVTPSGTSLAANSWSRWFKGTTTAATAAGSTATAPALRLGRGSLHLFALAELAGAWMVADHDVHHGSGFLCAWNALFVWQNGKRSARWLARGRVWPLALCGVAALQGFYFGRRFVSTSLE